MATFAEMLKNPRIDQIRLDGGILCFDFANTVPDRVDGPNRDNLKNYEDLIYWAKKAKILDSTSFAALEKVGEVNDKKTKSFFSEALDLRSLIYSIFLPVSRHQKVKPADLETFNKLTTRYFSFLEISIQKDRFVEQWNFSSDHFYSVTGPIIKSAYELLLSDKLERVKECPNCGWLFLDTTKNGRRRWCSMEDCGSNVKALEYYYRKKKEKK
jgi:predicted RNA-binding Zn ribbon-like protein